MANRRASQPSQKNHRHAYCAPSPPSPSDVHSVRLSRSSCMISVESCTDPIFTQWRIHNVSKTTHIPLPATTLQRVCRSAIARLRQSQHYPPQVHQESAQTEGPKAVVPRKGTLYESSLTLSSSAIASSNAWRAILHASSGFPSTS